MKELLCIMESKPLLFVVAQPERVRHDLAQLRRGRAARDFGQDERQRVRAVRDGGSGVHEEGAAEEVMMKSNALVQETVWGARVLVMHHKCKGV